MTEERVEYTGERHTGKALIVHEGGGWTAIPNSIIRRIADLGAGPFAVYCSIASHAFADKVTTFVGREAIARDVGLSVRQVSTHIGTLVENGLLRVETQAHSTGRSNVYTITEKPFRGGSGSVLPHPSGSVLPTNNTTTKNTTTPPSSPVGPTSGTPLQLGLDVQPGKTVQVPGGTTIMQPKPWDMVVAFNMGLEKNGRTADHTTPGIKRHLPAGKKALDLGMTEHDVLNTTVRLTKGGFWKDKPITLERVVQEWAAQPKKDVTIRKPVEVGAVFNPFEGGR